MICNDTILRNVKKQKNVTPTNLPPFVGVRVTFSPPPRAPIEAPLCTHRPVSFDCVSPPCQHRLRLVTMSTITTSRSPADDSVLVDDQVEDNLVDAEDLAVAEPVIVIHSVVVKDWRGPGPRHQPCGSRRLPVVLLHLVVFGRRRPGRQRGLDRRWPVLRHLPSRR